MTTKPANEFNAPWVKRMKAAVEKRLQCEVILAAWKQDPKTGAFSPVFHVPTEKMEHARILGLELWHSE